MSDTALVAWYALFNLIFSDSPQMCSLFADEETEAQRTEVNWDYGAKPAAPSGTRFLPCLCSRRLLWPCWPIGLSAPWK